MKGATLIGSGIETMQQISMVGNDLRLDNGVGVCGKEGQSVPVGVGQPTLKVDNLTVAAPPDPDLVPALPGTASPGDPAPVHALIDLRHVDKILRQIVDTDLHFQRQFILSVYRA